MRLLSTRKERLVKWHPLCQCDKWWSERSTTYKGQQTTDSMEAYGDHSYNSGPRFVYQGSLTWTMSSLGQLKTLRLRSSLNDCQTCASLGFQTQEWWALMLTWKGRTDFQIARGNPQHDRIYKTWFIISNIRKLYKLIPNY